MQHSLKISYLLLKLPLFTDLYTSTSISLVQVRVNKVAAWVLATILSFLIIASRKHYTVDVVVAWYTVPLVFLALERRWTTTRIELQTERSLDFPSHLMHDIVVIPQSASLAEGLDRIALMNNGDTSDMSQRKGNKGTSVVNGAFLPVP